MVKILSSLLALFLLVGCSNSNVDDNLTQMQNQNDEKYELKVLSPTGAPAISLLDVLDISDVSFVDGADMLQAAFVNPNPEFDLIVAPTNLGVKLNVAGKSNYKLISVLTWGNLYLVGNDEASLLDETKELAAFGEGAVPGLIFETLKEDLDIKANVTYYGSVQEAQAQLLSGKADIALIAEPAATATIAKAKEKDLSLKIIADLQDTYKTKTGLDGYPQASLFVNIDSYNKYATEINNLTSIIKTTISNFENDSEGLILKIDNIKPETIGVPNGQIIAKTFNRLGLRYVDGKDVKEELSTFLKLFNIDGQDYVME